MYTLVDIADIATHKLKCCKSGHYSRLRRPRSEGFDIHVNQLMIMQAVHTKLSNMSAVLSAKQPNTSTLKDKCAFFTALAAPNRTDMMMQINLWMILQ